MYTSTSILWCRIFFFLQNWCSKPLTLSSNPRRICLGNGGQGLQGCYDITQLLHSCFVQSTIIFHYENSLATKLLAKGKIKKVPYTILLESSHLFEPCLYLSYDIGFLYYQISNLSEFLQKRLDIVYLNNQLSGQYQYLIQVYNYYSSFNFFSWRT